MPIPPPAPQDYLSLADGLERIYQIVVGVAITEAVKRFIRETKPPASLMSPGSDANSSNNTDIYFSPRKESIPEAVAFFATVVPFFHGMNRYMEMTYGKGKPPSGILLLDIIVFLLEGGILFLLASSLTAKDLRFFRVMVFLFTIDSIWCILSYCLTDSPTALGWCFQNLVTIYLLMWFIRMFRANDLAAKYCCTAAVLLKTVWDYYYYWNTFYFAP